MAPKKTFYPKSHVCAMCFIRVSECLFIDVINLLVRFPWQKTLEIGSKSFFFVWICTCVCEYIFQNSERDQYQSTYRVWCFLWIVCVFTCTIFMLSLWFKIAIMAEFLHTHTKSVHTLCFWIQQAHFKLRMSLFFL